MCVVSMASSARNQGCSSCKYYIYCTIFRLRRTGGCKTTFNNVKFKQEDEIYYILNGMVSGKTLCVKL